MTSGFKDLEQTLENLGDEIEDEVNDTVESTMDDVASEARLTLGRNKTYYTNTLISSIQTSSDTEGWETSHKVYTEVPYAAYIEYGTGEYSERAHEGIEGFGPSFDAPDNVPNQEIYDWIVAKGITSREYPTADELSWAITAHIEEHGTRAQPFLRPAFAKFRYAFGERAAAAVSEALHEA